MKYLATLASGAAMALALSATAHADYKMAGCGLGSMLIKDDGFVQIFAATTNGTFANQTFGISTGTSNCVKSGVVLASREQEAFFEASLGELKTDIARGSGEHLQALSELFSCKESVRARMFERAQASFSVVFPSATTTPVQALYVLKLQLSQDEEIAAGCTL